jgi:hypothetical protein
MIATTKSVRSIPSGRRAFCARVVKAEMPFVTSLNVVVTRFNVLEYGEIKKCRLMALHPVDRARLTPLEIAK